MSGARRRERYLAVEVREGNGGPPREGFLVLETAGFLGRQDGRLFLLLDPGLAAARLVPLGEPDSTLEPTPARLRLRLTADGLRNRIGYAGMSRYHRPTLGLNVVSPPWYRLLFALGCVNMLLVRNLSGPVMLALMHVERPQTWRFREPDGRTVESTLDRRFRRVAKALDQRALGAAT